MLTDRYCAAANVSSADTLTMSGKRHVPTALMAAAAGKDVYTEKPLGISIEQDKKSREIVDKHQRVFQCGAQQRSRQHVRQGIEPALNGHLGEVQEAYVWAPHGESGGKLAETPVPPDFDYRIRRPRNALRRN